MNKIKIPIVLLLTTLSFSMRAHAVPVMNENAAVSGLVTMFPDHADPGLFYIAPNVLAVCLDQAGVPRFSYQDLDVSILSGGKHGIVQMTLCARYSQTDLDAAKAALIARVPNARFVALPFLSSRITFNEVLKPFVVKEFCSHPAGMVGDEQTCSFRLNKKGRKIFIQNVRDRVTMTMQYEYSVAGFIRKADGGFASQNTTYSVAARIGGEELKDHPELFVDSSGKTLKPKK